MNNKWAQENLGNLPNLSLVDFVNYQVGKNKIMFTIDT